MSTRVHIVMVAARFATMAYFAPKHTRCREVLLHGRRKQMDIIERLSLKTLTT